MPNKQTKLTRRDLKIFPSANLTDLSTGGGLPRGIALSDSPNELFSPISSIDRTQGMFNARIIYAGVICDDNETLYGSFFAITEPPKDSAVSYIAYPASSFGATLADLHTDYETWSASTGSGTGTQFYGVQSITESIQKETKKIIVSALSEIMTSTQNNSSLDVQFGTNSGLGIKKDESMSIFSTGRIILISNKQSEDIGTAHTGGQTVSLSRNDVDSICLVDNDGTPINAELWSYDLQAGTITWSTLLDLSSYKMPVIAHHTQHELNTIASIGDAQSQNTLNLSFPTKRAYAIEDTYVSSVLPTGNLQVLHSNPFTQRNWNGEWRDSPNGEQLLNKLNIQSYPIVLTSDSTITDRWLIKFTGSNQIEVYSEMLGFVGIFDTLTDVSPINPETKKPFWTIPKEAFGNDAPWAVQDVIRFNTFASLVPIYIMRLVQPNQNTQDENDGIKMCLFGDTTELS